MTSLTSNKKSKKSSRSHASSSSRTSEPTTFTTSPTASTATTSASFSHTSASSHYGNTFPEHCGRPSHPVGVCGRAEQDAALVGVGSQFSQFRYADKAGEYPANLDLSKELSK